MISAFLWGFFLLTFSLIPCFCTSDLATCENCKDKSRLLGYLILCSACFQTTRKALTAESPGELRWLNPWQWLQIMRGILNSACRDFHPRSWGISALDVQSISMFHCKCLMSCRNPAWRSGMKGLCWSCLVNLIPPSLGGQKTPPPRERPLPGHRGWWAAFWRNPNSETSLGSREEWFHAFNEKKVFCIFVSSLT